MTTDQAFEQLLNDPDLLWKRTGLSDSRRRELKGYIDNGRDPKLSLNKKIELLEKAGFVKKQDIVWGLRGGFVREEPKK